MAHACGQRAASRGEWGLTPTRALTVFTETTSAGRSSHLRGVVRTPGRRAASGSAVTSCTSRIPSGVGATRARPPVQPN